METIVLLILLHTFSKRRNLLQRWSACGPTAAFADTYCGQASSGATVYAGNSDTSCEFAMSTAEAYRNYGKGSNPFSVVSPVTGQTYTMTCTNAGSVCQGGNNAIVYLRSS